MLSNLKNCIFDITVYDQKIRVFFIELSTTEIKLEELFVLFTFFI